MLSAWPKVQINGYIDGRVDPNAAPYAIVSFLTWLDEEFEKSSVALTLSLVIPFRPRRLDYAGWHG